MRRNRIFAMVLTAALLVQSLGTSAYAAGADVVPGATVIETVEEDETVSLEEESEEQTMIEESYEEENSSEELSILESGEATDKMSEPETVVETATDEMIETESILTTEQKTVEETAEETTVVEVTEAVTEEETVTEEIAVDVRTETEAVEIAGLSQLKEVFGVEESVSGNTVTVILTSDIRLTGALEIDENITILAQGNRKIMRASTVDNIHMFHVMPEGVLTLGKESGMGEGNTMTLDGEADLYVSEEYHCLCNDGVMTKDASTVYNEQGGTVNAYAGIAFINSGVHIEYTNKTEKMNLTASALTNYGKMYLKDVLIAGNGPTDIPISEWEGDYCGQLPAILNRGLEANMIFDGCRVEDNYCASGVGYQVEGVITNIGGEMYWKDSIYKTAEDEKDTFDYRITYSTTFMNAGTLTVDGGDIEAMAVGVFNLNSITDADYNLLTDEIVFYLKDGTLRTRKYCDSVVRNHGRFEMSGGLITGQDGALVFNYGDCNLEPSDYSGVFILDGGVIDGKNMIWSAVVNESEMFMTGGTITGAQIGLDHDFVQYDKIPKVFRTTVSGGTIKGCSFGVEINGGEFILDGGEITQNQEGVYMHGSSQRAVFTMNGGKITNGGKYGYDYCAVRLSGYDERLTDYHIFNFNGGLISGNMGKEGCGVYIDGERTIWNVAGGQITDNYATEEWDFNDGNYAPIKDGAVYVAEETEVNIKDGLKYSEIIFNNHHGIEPTTPKVTGMLQELTLQLDSKASLKASSSMAGYEIVYSGYDADIIDVALDGTVTAKAIGKTTVTAKVGEDCKTCTVYVRDIHADMEEVVLTRGESQSITLKETKVTGEDGSTEMAVTDTVNWSVENDLVAEVSGSGSSATIKGQGAGTTYVIASVGSNANNRQNRMDVKIPVKILVPLKNASLSRSKLTMQKGAEASIAVYASPYDTTDNYSIKWVSSDENIATVSGNKISAKRAQIHALNNGKAEIKAVLTIGEGENARTVESPVCTVKIMGTEGIPELEPVYVLTNQATTLSQVKLPDGFSWKETEAGETASVKLEAGDEYQSYIAIYEDKENYIYGEKEVLLAVGTVSGIKTQSSILVDATVSEGSLIGELSVEPVYKGRVDKESLTFLATVDSAYSNAMTVTAKEGEPSVFEIKATNPEAVYGKKVKTVFTMKLEGGDPTVKAQKGKLWFEAASTISVAEKGKTVADSMEIVFDGKTVTELTLDASHIKDELVLGAVVKDSSGNDITAGTKLTWKSSNAKTASVDKNGKVAIKGEGNTLISVTAGDGSSTSAVLKLEIRDYRPRAGANTLTVNYAYANGTELTIHPAYGSNVKEIAGIVIYDSKKKEYVDASSLFELQAGENVNSYILKAKEGAAVTRNKKATYNLIINTKITVAGAEDTPVQFSDADGISVKVTVVNTIPKVTVKQSSKINLFYKDTQAQAVINAAGADITDVKWKENGEVDFELTKFTSDGNKAAVIIGQKSTIPVKADGTADTGKLKKKGVLLISLEGYAEPAEVKFQVNTENKKPLLKLKKERSA